MARPHLPTRVVLLDLDGTVWDSRPGIVDALGATLDELGMAVPPPPALRHCVGPPLKTTLAALGVGPDRLAEAVSAYRRHYRAVGEPTVVLFDGVPDMLDDLRATGHRLVTATSKGVDPVRRLLARLGVADRFDAVAAAPMNGPGADKVDVVRAALRLAGDPDPGAVVMVGDRAGDVEAARHHGIGSIAARWGYAAPGELEAARPGSWAAAPEEVAEQLGGRRTRFAAGGAGR